MIAEHRTYTHDRAQGGYSLTELLVTLAILMLVTSIMATGAPAALRAYMGVVDASNANILLTTTATRLRDELSMADPDTSTMVFKSGTNVLKSFVSLETGYRISFEWKNDGYLYKVEQSTENPSLDPVKTILVPKKFSSAAGSSVDLRTTFDSIVYEDGVFTVSGLKVVKKKGSEESENGSRPTGDIMGGAKYENLKIRVLAATG